MGELVGESILSAEMSLDATGTVIGVGAAPAAVMERSRC